MKKRPSAQGQHNSFFVHFFYYKKSFSFFCAVIVEYCQKINITFSLSIQCTLKMLHVDDSYSFLCAVIVELYQRSRLLFICQCTLYLLNALYMYYYSFMCVVKVS